MPAGRGRLNRRKGSICKGNEGGCSREGNSRVEESMERIRDNGMEGNVEKCWMAGGKAAAESLTVILQRQKNLDKPSTHKKFPRIQKFPQLNSDFMLLKLRQHPDSSTAEALRPDLAFGG